MTIEEKFSAFALSRQLPLQGMDWTTQFAQARACRRASETASACLMQQRGTSAIETVFEARQHLEDYLHVQGPDIEQTTSSSLQRTTTGERQWLAPPTSNSMTSTARLVIGSSALRSQPSKFGKGPPTWTMHKRYFLRLGAGTAAPPCT